MIQPQLAWGRGEIHHHYLFCEEIRLFKLQSYAPPIGLFSNIYFLEHSCYFFDKLRNAS